MNLRSAHHAGSRKHGVVDGIGADVAATADKLDLDHHEVVDMVEILADGLLLDSRIAAADDEVPGSARSDLVGHVAS